MKRTPGRIISVTVMLTFMMLVRTYSQATAEVNQQLLDMKLELLNSQIELFNSQLKLWETKPLELEQKLIQIDGRIDQLDFDPIYFNTKLQKIELLIDEYQAASKKTKKQESRSLRPDSVISLPYKNAIAINPVRLFEGTFQITYERAITPRVGLGISGLATFATEEGVSRFYMRNQKLDYYNEALSSSMPYYNNNISGYGIGLFMKNYLLTDQYVRQRSPVGLYAAPSLLFRRLWLSGMSQYYLEDEWVEEEVTRLLNIFAFGAHIGWKFTFLKVLYFDMYVGGQIRLAKYDDEERFTRYKNLGNIDFSGVMPAAGLSIGILK